MIIVSISKITTDSILLMPNYPISNPLSNDPKSLLLQHLYLIVLAMLYFLKIPLSPMPLLIDARIGLSSLQCSLHQICQDIDGGNIGSRKSEVQCGSFQHQQHFLYPIAYCIHGQANVLMLTSKQNARVGILTIKDIASRMRSGTPLKM